MAASSFKQRPDFKPQADNSCLEERFSRKKRSRLRSAGAKRLVDHVEMPFSVMSSPIK